MAAKKRAAAKTKNVPSNQIPLDRAKLRLECLKLAATQARHAPQLEAVAEHLFLYLFSGPGEALDAENEGGR